MHTKISFKLSRWSEFLKRQFGLNNHKNLYWSKYEPRNFGDWITPYLFEKSNEFKPVFCPPLGNFFTTTIFGAGSILRHLNQKDCAIIWGSGIICSEDNFSKPKEILAVRGPLTRKRCLSLGYDCPEIYGDPGIILPNFYTPIRPKVLKPLGIIPHYINYNVAIRVFGKMREIKIIDVTKPIEDVINEIVGCRVTVSGSLHGLIVSHSYGIPSTWVEFGNELMGDGIKFQDYFQSLSIFDIVTPVLIDEKNTFDELLAIGSAHQVPNHEGLKKQLIKVCPFIK